MESAEVKASSGDVRIWTQEARLEDQAHNRYGLLLKEEHSG